MVPPPPPPPPPAPVPGPSRSWQQPPTSCNLAEHRCADAQTATQLAPSLSHHRALGVPAGVGDTSHGSLPYPPRSPGYPAFECRGPPPATRLRPVLGTSRPYLPFPDSAATAPTLPWLSHRISRGSLASVQACPTSTRLRTVPESAQGKPPSAAAQRSTSPAKPRALARWRCCGAETPRTPYICRISVLAAKRH